MPPVVLNGPQYLAEGLKLMLRPGLRLFVLLPLLVNLLVFGGLIVFAVQQFGSERRGAQQLAVDRHQGAGGL